MGSGAKSVPFPKLLDAIAEVFAVAAPAKLQIATRTAPLSPIEEAWGFAGNPRVIVAIP